MFQTESRNKSVIMEDNHPENSFVFGLVCNCFRPAWQQKPGLQGQAVAV